MTLSRVIHSVVLVSDCRDTEADKFVGNVVVGDRRSWTAVCPVENEVKTLSLSDLV